MFTSKGPKGLIIVSIIVILLVIIGLVVTGGQGFEGHWEITF